MKRFYSNRPDGYQQTIRKGLTAVRAFQSGVSCCCGRQKQIAGLRFKMENADAIVTGAGANTPVFYGLNPVPLKMTKNSRFYPGNGYFMKELSMITDSERLRRCA